MSKIRTLNAETNWHRSRFCADHACVEVAFVADGVAIRDSKDKDAEPLVVSSEDFRIFSAWLKATASVG